MKRALNRYRPAIRLLIPAPARSFLKRAARKLTRQRVKAIRWGDLRRTEPVSPDWGFERGTPVDRYYIERFLEQNRRDIRGRVLEVLEPRYTTMFGSGVTYSEVVHVEEGYPQTTVVADLSDGEGLTSDHYDCVILTQTLQCIPDTGAAVRTLHRILKPGGVVLATIPTITRISRYDMDRWGDYWRMTTRGARYFFDPVFDDDVVVEAFGNVLVATAFLHGVAAEELTSDELSVVDPDFEFLVAVRARKGSSRR
ncbi:hypothetical protein BH18ACT15_BH18ACT15_13640 [soil metagenome]